MAISFATYDLLLASPELQAYLDRYLPTVESTFLADFMGAGSSRTQSRNPHAKLPPGIARPNYPPAPPLRINSLYFPTGATRWGRFLGLCDTETKDKILKLAGGSTAAPVAKPLTIHDESQSILLDMFLLPPRRLTHLENPKESALWLLPLVDERYLWQFKNAGNIEIDAGETWSSYINELASRLGVTLTASAIPSAYLYPDPLECSRPYENVAVILDAVAHSIGRRFVPERRSGSHRVMDWDYAETRLAENLAKNWAQMMGAEFDTGLYTSQATLELICPHYVKNMQSCGLTKITATIGNGYASTVRSIRTTAAAKRDTFGGSETNTAALQALADQIADDLILSHYNYDRTFAGMLPWDLTSWDDHVEWTVGRWHPEHGYLAQTRIQSSPYNFGVDEMLHQVQGRVFPIGSYIGKTNEAITALSGSTPGSGAVSIYETDDANGNLADTGIDSIAYNMAAQAVASGKWVRMHHDGCRLFIEPDDLCAIMSGFSGYTAGSRQYLAHQANADCPSWVTPGSC